MTTAKALYHDWRDLSATRYAMLAEFDKQAEDIRKCVHWLTAQDVAILAIDLRRNRRQPHIQVAAATLLHRLFGEDCATVERRQDGDSLVYTWAATRFDCAIRWEEFA
ncbi:MAG: hypothetical protein WBJ68_14060 [Candidatus Dechloromonas phosphoritropha]|jgi:hypothetical protein